MAGSSNFLLFNPNAANQETDAEYSADPSRSGGAGVNSIFRSALANKLFYQLSIFVAAFCQMMAQKGYTLSDADFGALVSVLANVLTNADQRPDLISVPFSPNLQLDCSKSNGFQVILTGNVASISIINATFGQMPIQLTFTQGGGGGFAVATPPNVRGMGVIDPGAGNNSTQLFSVLADGNLHAIGPMVVT